MLMSTQHSDQETEHEEDSRRPLYDPVVHETAPTKGNRKRKACFEFYVETMLCPLFVSLFSLNTVFVRFIQGVAYTRLSFSIRCEFLALHYCLKYARFKMQFPNFKSVFCQPPCWKSWTFFSSQSWFKGFFFPGIQLLSLSFFHLSSQPKHGPW